MESNIALFRPPYIKRIYWVKEKSNVNGMFAHIHLLLPHTLGTIAQFQIMAAKMRETFTEAEDSKVFPGTVFRSDKFYGYLIIAFDSFITKVEYPGWEQLESGTWEYQW